MLLLDTHAFLWFLNGDEKLPDQVRLEIQTNEAVFVSIASFWEIAIKNSLGKLELDASIPALMELCAQLRFSILPISAAHLENVRSLPWIHRDPFDRLLISQASTESMTLVTADESIAKYEVNTFWKKA